MYMYCIAIGILNRSCRLRSRVCGSVHIRRGRRPRPEEGRRPPSAPPPKQLEEFFVMKV